MPTRTDVSDKGMAFKIAAAGLGFACLIVAPTTGLAQTNAAKATATIQRGSETERALKMEEPSYQTREERLKAKPLDWNSTIGKPTRRVLTPAEKQALRKARPGATEGGAPNPEAEKEARKLHPDDWK